MRNLLCTDLMEFFRLARVLNVRLLYKIILQVFKNKSVHFNNIENHPIEQVINNNISKKEKFLLLDNQKSYIGFLGNDIIYCNRFSHTTYHSALTVSVISHVNTIRQFHQCKIDHSTILICLKTYSSFINI